MINTVVYLAGCAFLGFMWGTEGRKLNLTSGQRIGMLIISILCWSWIWLPSL